jgi:site-specific DNA recombinase
MTNKKQTAVGYLRVSTEKQNDSQLGLSAQRAQIKEYASRNGLKIVRWYEDVASGASQVNERKGLSSLINELEPETRVLVANRSRVAREMMLSLWVEKEIKRVHCVLESCDGSGNGDSPTDALLRNILSSFADFERHQISDRTKRALQELKKTRTLGRPTFGHRYNDLGELEPDPETYPTYLRMMELRSEGLNYSQIQRMLNKEKHRSQTGKEFSPSLVRNLIARIESNKEE